MGSKICVGLIGVGNWAAYGHIPALKSLSGFEISAIASRRIEKATELAQRFHIPHAFGDPSDLIAHPDVDLVAVLPPAPEHARLSRQAIDAGKAVYCEWPLTTSTSDSEDLLARANAAGVRHLTGLQRRMGASARYVRDLLRHGYIGQLRSVRIHVSMEYFGPRRPASLEWTLPAANFSHILSIYGGHFFDLLFSIVGNPTSVNAIITPQFPQITLERTGESFPNETPDAVLAQGRLEDGGLYTAQLEGGKQHNFGLQIDFTGTNGDLKVENAKSFGNNEDNFVWGASGTAGNGNSLKFQRPTTCPSVPILIPVCKIWRTSMQAIPPRSRTTRRRRHLRTRWRCTGTLTEHLKHREPDARSPSSLRRVVFQSRRF